MFFFFSSTSHFLMRSWWAALTLGLPVVVWESNMEGGLHWEAWKVAVPKIPLVTVIDASYISSWWYYCSVAKMISWTYFTEINSVKRLLQATQTYLVWNHLLHMTWIQVVCCTFGVKPLSVRFSKRVILHLKSAEENVQNISYENHTLFGAEIVPERDRRLEPSSVSFLVSYSARFFVL